MGFEFSSSYCEIVDWVHEVYERIADSFCIYYSHIYRDIAQVAILLVACTVGHHIRREYWSRV